MSTPNWPIHVGGEYRAAGSFCDGFYRVIAIDGDTIHSWYMWPGDVKPMSVHGMESNVFRMVAVPEDQSPIPALVEALQQITRAAKSMSEHLVAAGGNSMPEVDRRIAVAEAALAKVGAQ